MVLLLLSSCAFVLFKGSAFRLVKVFMVIFFPIAYPLSCLVRLLLGDHTGMTYKRNELKELVGLLTGNQLTKDEVSVITGALTLIERKPEEIMIPLEDVYMLDSKTIITRALLAQVLLFKVSQTFVCKLSI